MPSATYIVLLFVLLIICFVEGTNLICDQSLWTKNAGEEAKGAQWQFNNNGGGVCSIKSTRAPSQGPNMASIYLTAQTYTDFELTMEIEFSGFECQGGVSLRADAANPYSNILNINRRYWKINGLNGYTSGGIGYVENQIYTLYVKAIGDDYTIKFTRPDGTVEVDTTYTYSGGPSSGIIGVWARNNNGDNQYTVTFHSLTITDLSQNSNLICDQSVWTKNAGEEAQGAQWEFNNNGGTCSIKSTRAPSQGPNMASLYLTAQTYTNFELTLEIEFSGFECQGGLSLRADASNPYSNILNLNRRYSKINGLNGYASPGFGYQENKIYTLYLKAEGNEYTIKFTRFDGTVEVDATYTDSGGPSSGIIGIWARNNNGNNQYTVTFHSLIITELPSGPTSSKVPGQCRLPGGAAAAGHFQGGVTLHGRTIDQCQQDLETKHAEDAGFIWAEYSGDHRQICWIGRNAGYTGNGNPPYSCFIIDGSGPAAMAEGIQFDESPDIEYIKISQSTLWIIGGMISLLMVCNVICCCMTYVKGKNHPYQMVKYAASDSDFDGSNNL